MSNETKQSLQEKAWSDWKQHPNTQIFFKLLKRQYEETKEDWAAEEFIGNSQEEMAVKNATAIGGVRILRSLIYKTPAELAVEQETLDE